jgi:hypothetical protein
MKLNHADEPVKPPAHADATAPNPPPPTAAQRPADFIEMPFGRFKGQKVSQIRSWYLRWTLDNLPAMRQSLRDVIEDELRFREHRKQSGGKP